MLTINRWTIDRLTIGGVPLTARPYAGEQDLGAIVQFLNACEVVDQQDVFYSATVLGREMTEPGFDPARDVRLWLRKTDEGAEQIIGFAQMWIPHATPDDREADGHLWFRVLPQMRWQGLEAEMLAWAEGRMAEIGRSRELPARLRLGCRETEGDRIAWFERSGLEQVRCFLRMRRDLAQPIPAVELPPGFELAHSLWEADAALRMELHNEAFMDHWNHHPATFEEWQHWDADPAYRPELDLLAIAPDGTYAAYARCGIDREENAARGCAEGWINVLGTLPQFRRRGLARAMLLAGLTKLQAEGMTVAFLGVDTQNINQAQTLYESVGFERAYANLAYAKWVDMD
jgi:mycothiol synthase